jgi:hypothetical protein
MLVSEGRHCIAPSDLDVWRMSAFLLEEGANPYFKDSPRGRIPLEEAEDSVRSEIPEIIELLKNAARLRGAAKGA